MKLDLPNLVEDRGRLYVRVMLNGRSRKIRLREEPGTTAFLTAFVLSCLSFFALENANDRHAVVVRKADAVPSTKGTLGGSL